MNTLRFLLRSIGARSILLAPVGLAGAACSAALMATIHRVLSDEQAGSLLLLSFVAFGAGRIAAAYVSNVSLGDRAARAAAALRDDIIARLLRVPYRRFERAGASRVLSALTHDVAMLEAALTSLPNAATSLAILLGGTAYLLYLSPLLFAALALLVLVCLAIFRLAARYAEASYERKRAAYTRLWELLGALVNGAKELRQHAARRHEFLTGPLRQTSAALLEHERAARFRYAIAGALNHALVLAVLALVLFALPQRSALRAEVATGYVLVGLYLMSPLAALARLWPSFRAAQRALDSLHELGVQLAAADEPDGAQAGGAQPGGAPADGRPSAARIALQHARYRYDDERGFTLGPLSLQVGSGELLFIAGGNGSGKSTLGRLLVGLYAPDAGELRRDGEPVGARDLDRYRQLWSAVFSDVHLFDRLYGIDPAAREQRAAELLGRLELQSALHVHDGAFSSLALSAGQRKRVALLVALLEDRPFYLFDEWAADQDPDWKRIFYRELLPELRARGKGVVVITHDDRYFDVADRVLALRDGQLAA